MSNNGINKESPAQQAFLKQVEQFVDAYVAQNARISLKVLEYFLAHPHDFCRCPGCRGGAAIIARLQKDADYWHEMLGQPDMGTNQVIIASNLANLPPKILDIELKFDPDSDLCGNCPLYDLCERSIQDGNTTSVCRHNLP